MENTLTKKELIMGEQQDNILTLKQVSWRLPYGVKCLYINNFGSEKFTLQGLSTVGCYAEQDICPKPFYSVKLILRSFDSLTAEDVYEMVYPYVNCKPSDLRRMGKSWIFQDSLLLFSFYEPDRYPFYIVQYLLENNFYLNEPEGTYIIDNEAYLNS